MLARVGGELHFVCDSPGCERQVSYHRTTPGQDFCSEHRPMTAREQAECARSLWILVTHVCLVIVVLALAAILILRGG